MKIGRLREVRTETGGKPAAGVPGDTLTVLRSGPNR